MGGKTSTEVKNRWNAKTYKCYYVNFRRDADAELIKFIDKNKEHIGTTNLFREAIESYMAKEREV